MPPLDPPRSSGGFDEGAPAPAFEFSEPPRIGSTSVTTAGLGDRRSGPAAAVLPRALHNAARVPVTQNLRRRFGLATSLRRNTRGEGGQDCACVVAAAVPVGAERRAKGEWLVGGIELFLRDHRLHDTRGQPPARVTPPSLARGLLVVGRSRGPSSLCRPKLRKPPGRRAVAGRYYPSKPRRV